MNRCFLDHNPSLRSRLTYLQTLLAEGSCVLLEFSLPSFSAVRQGEGRLSTLTWSLVLVTWRLSPLSTLSLRLHHSLGQGNIEVQRLWMVVLHFTLSMNARTVNGCPSAALSRNSSRYSRTFSLDHCRMSSWTSIEDGNLQRSHVRTSRSGHVCGGSLRTGSGIKHEMNGLRYSMVGPACALPVYVNLITTFHPGLDACVVPILSPDEAAQLAGSEVPIPHPKLNPPPDLCGLDGDLSSHNSRLRTLIPGEHTREILSEFGLSTTEVENLRLTGALRVIAPVKPRL